MTRQPDVSDLLQALPDPVLILSSDLTVRAANEVFLDVTGVRREDLVDRRLLEDVFPDPVDCESAPGRASLRESIATVLRTGMPDVAQVHRYDLPSGRRRIPRKRYWSITNSPIIDSDGVVRHLSMRVKDVTVSRGLLAATLGALTTSLDGGRPLTATRLQDFSEYLTDAGRRGLDTDEILGQVDELLSVLQTRTIIEQAKGMLMASARISADQAYELLRQESQHTNVKLRDVAAHHVAIHTTPLPFPVRSADDDGPESSVA